MLGPVFAREALTLPRGVRQYVWRVVHVGSLLLLLTTAWQVLAGAQVVRNLGDLARFATLAFQLLAPLQLVVAVFFAALAAASAVSLEKERKTLELLLLTGLTNFELVVGKLLASVLRIVLLVVAAGPFFALLALLGGVSFGQVLGVVGVTVAGTLVAASLGSTLAFWREKTLPALALTALTIVAWTAAWEAVGQGLLGGSLAGLPIETWAAMASPWHALADVTAPHFDAARSGPLGAFGPPAFYLFAAAAAVLLNGYAVWRVRVWNPPRVVLPAGRAAIEAGEDASTASAPEANARADHAAMATHSATPWRPGATRPVWNQPLLWREVRTWAYGRRVLLVRLAYVLLFVVGALAVRQTALEGGHREASRLAGPIAPLLVLSLLLVNAQAVTSLTSERDLKALDLLLVTDITPREFVWGKLLGAVYNAKEVILLPAALAGYLAWLRLVSLEELTYLLGGWAALVTFAATLGLHVGMTYANSRTAIAVSLGTVFFLFVGVATTMRIITAFSGSFQAQLQPFLAAIVVGGVGLYAALGYRNPSTAMAVATFLLPVATFYALTSFLLGATLAVFLVVVAAYGFTTLAMLVPAIHEFDVATGRTHDDGADGRPPTD